MRTERYLVSGWGPGLALLLFATGSLENEFRFDADGSLQTRWRNH